MTIMLLLFLFNMEYLDFGYLENKNFYFAKEIDKGDVHLVKQKSRKDDFMIIDLCVNNE